MSKLLCSFVFLATQLLLIQSSFAVSVGLTNVSQSEFRSITKEVGASGYHSSLTSAKRNEKTIQLGLISGSANSSSISSLISRYSSGSNLSSIPHAGLLATFNFGSQFVAEAIALPPLTVSSIKLDSQSLAVKWFAADLIPASVDLAVRAFFGRAAFQWSQTISSVNTEMKYSQNSWGIIFEASKQYGYFEPYLNLGLALNSAQLSSSGASIFNSSYSTSSTSKESTFGLVAAAGVSSTFSIINFALEFGSIYGTFATSIKTSAYF